MNLPPDICAVLQAKERNDMSRTARFFPGRLSRVVVWLIVFGLAFSPAQSLLAQDVVPDVVTATGPSASSAEMADDAAFLWQIESVGAVAEKASTVSNADDADKAEQFGNSLYLPSTQNDSPSGDSAGIAHHNGWHTIMFEGFGGVFPAGCWTVRDTNGGYDGIHQWDDALAGGFWYGHPNDGFIYRNIMDTYMRCGPLNLQNVAGDPVLGARLLFSYWLDTEAGYDFFSWEYSCNGVTNWSGGESRSGYAGVWRHVNTSLNNCIGSANVYIRFNFRSDNIITDNGVWVDNIYVQKFY
jgi:hypothetical protein